jgi:hypothetical protein
MSVSAAKLSAVDNLFTYNPKAFVKNNNAEKSESIMRILEQEIDFVESPTVFFYNNRIRLTISIRTSLSEFILLKGLIEFHRSKNFIFTYNKTDQTIEADFQEKEFDAFRSFLKSVSTWLQAEAKFKATLKGILDFEARYRQERNAIYSTLVK